MIYAHVFNKIEAIKMTKLLETLLSKKPIIPSQDGCCIKVCKSLNKEIDNITHAIRTHKKHVGISKLKLEQNLETLGLLREELKYDKSCQCVE